MILNFFPNSQDVKDGYHHKLLEVLKLRGKKNPFLLGCDNFTEQIVTQYDFWNNLPCTRKVRASEKQSQLWSKSH
jgi:hypothetical protein